ncbi:sensor histidine kinase [Plantactinospora sp. S1510]|uniref:histidine kinase n=1 Tax=Plantactinospora alkalitolerans TaxID=2789879 RepID=A0ABS0H5D8_9ACTN|nr:nitrate- and nitrite sensing domain-containing protein [Plantactinospora alkalitolerans]MBF9133700.1 sensor histidine kinase [Plantactinospora alkalitolerans]
MSRAVRRTAALRARLRRAITIRRVSAEAGGSGPANGSGGPGAVNRPAGDGGSATRPATGGNPIRLVQKANVLLLVLAVLWGYAAFLTARESMDLLAVRTLGTQLGQPTEALVLGLQAERRLTMVELGAPGRHRTALAEARNRTDAAIGVLRRFAGDSDSDLRLLTVGTVRERAAQLVRRLDAVRSLRDTVDGGTVDRASAATSYGQIIDAGFAVYGSQWASRRTDLIEETRSLVALARSAELLAREDALVAGALAANRLTEAEHRQLVDLVAVARFARTEAAAGLPFAERVGYDRLVGGPVFGTLDALEAELLAAGRSAGSPRVQPAGWQAATEPALSGLRNLVARGVRRSVERATPGAVGVVARTGLVGGLGLVTVVAAAMLTIRTTRRVVGRLDQLTAEHAALGTARDGLTAELAAQRERTARLTTQAAQLSAQRKRLATQREQLVAQTGRRQAEAERVTERATQIATRLAALQRIREVFVRLTRDNQSLLHRQIGLLDAMERRETDTDELAELFQLDHLATRIRRNVEQMISLSGGTPGRRWRRPVPLVDVVRGAVAEASDYPRVLVAPNWSGSVAGRALPDLIHLLAEVVEAALAGSPPTTTVRISGEFRDGGAAITVSDDGAGRGPAELDAVNELIRDTPTTAPLGGSVGLYVVGRLARRHGVTVELTAGARGGTTAIVRVPDSLLVDTPASGPETTSGGATPTGRPADNAVGRPGGTARPGAAPPPLPVRVRRPHEGNAAGATTRTANPHPNGAPVRPAETDWSVTMELPVSVPTPIDGQAESSERTTGDSRSGHDG